MSTQNTQTARGIARGMSHLGSETREALFNALWFGIEESKALETSPVWARISWGVNILRDMNGKLERYGSLSDKQVDFALKLHAEAKQRVSETDERAAVAAKLAASGVRAPEGRVSVVGTILRKKTVYSDFGDTVKCLIELPTGAKVWGSQPNSRNAGHVEIGGRVSFTASFEVSKDDPTFAFYKRPTAWTNVTIDQRAAA